MSHKTRLEFGVHFMFRIIDMKRRGKREGGGTAGARATPTLIEGGGQCPPTLMKCYRVLPLLVGPV